MPRLLCMLGRDEHLDENQVGDKRRKASMQMVIPKYSRARCVCVGGCLGWGVGFFFLCFFVIPKTVSSFFKGLYLGGIKTYGNKKEECYKRMSGYSK